MENIHMLSDKKQAKQKETLNIIKESILLSIQAKEPVLVFDVVAPTADEKEVWRNEAISVFTDVTERSLYISSEKKRLAVLWTDDSQMVLYCVKDEMSTVQKIKQCLTEQEVYDLVKEIDTFDSLRDYIYELGIELVARNRREQGLD
jgi:uncharacterized protein YhbP (UPF0306 family)